MIVYAHDDLRLLIADPSVDLSERFVVVAVSKNVHILIIFGCYNIHVGYVHQKSGVLKLIESTSIDYRCS